MKTNLFRLAALLGLLAMSPVFGQPVPPQSPGGLDGGGLSRKPPPPVPVPPVPVRESLTRFDLDFPGGTPEELVKAIQKAGGPAPNVIVPPELRMTELPSFKVQSVTVPELFEAIGQASLKLVQNWIIGPGGQLQRQSKPSQYGFRTKEATPTDSSVWYFFVEGEGLPEPPLPEPPRVIRYYNISSYLDDGYKFEDIITAVETGWEMLSDERQASAWGRLRFHEDTSLLIAVGTEEQLGTIQAVLQQLGQSSATGYGGGGGFGGFQWQTPPRPQTVRPVPPRSPAPPAPDKPSPPKPERD